MLLFIFVKRWVHVSILINKGDVVTCAYVLGVTLVPSISSHACYVLHVTYMLHAHPTWSILRRILWCVHLIFHLTQINQNRITIGYLNYLNREMKTYNVRASILMFQTTSIIMLFSIDVYTMHDVSGSLIRHKYIRIHPYTCTQSP